MKKICNKCNETKDITEFAKNKTRKDGYNNICKACFKLYRDQHYQNNKDYYLNKNKKYKEFNKNLFEEFKKSLKCSVCGESRPQCLDFHHLDPSKKDENISKLFQTSPFKLQKELEKCIILCANCHRDLHYKEKTKND